MATFPNTAGANTNTVQGALAWTVLDVADSTGSRDPSSILTGAITMGGTGSEYLQIPVATSSLTDDSLADCALYYFPVPAASSGTVRMVAEIDGTWGNNFGVGLGFVDVGLLKGQAAGIIYDTSNYGAWCCNWASTSLSAQDVPDTNPAQISLTMTGPLDGVGNSAAMAHSSTSDGSVARAASRAQELGLYTSSTVMCLAVIRSGSTSATTLSVRVRYAVVGDPA